MEAFAKLCQKPRPCPPLKHCIQYRGTEKAARRSHKNRMSTVKDPHREKTMVALSSVGAAIGLTSIKVIVALLTGSLGILAEAAHSGLDLVAALMTFFAVRVADRPADATHHYGHGKVENLSAFLEAGLLLLTAVWVIYEAIRRLLFHEGHVDASIWAIAVMCFSILVDYTRSRALLRVARKLGSQALEADALHFRTDIWSSSVVIVGLLDRAPGALAAQVEEAIKQVEGVTEVRRVRVRRAGNKLFADVVIAAPRISTFEQTHELTQRIEAATLAGVRSISPQGEVDVVVHVEPTTAPGETVIDQIHYLAE